MYNRFFFFVFLLFVFCESKAQNLVPNPSFEEFQNGCPENLNEMPIGWSWWRESPNSFSTCVQPEELIDSLGWAPWNGFGWQEPFDGDSYVGLCAFGPSPKSGVPPDYREYLGCELSEPLQVGVTYFVSFRTNLALDGSYYFMTLASNRLGAYFTMEGYEWPENELEVPNFAHVYTNEVITDTLNWVTISGNFIADQPYTHMGFGVFFEFDSLNTLALISDQSLGSYYFLDQVSVTEDPNGVFNVNLLSGNDIIILPNPANEMVVITDLYPIELLRIFNSQGKLVLAEKLATTTCTIDTNQIPSGTYIVEVSNGKFSKREKLIVMH